MAQTEEQYKGGGGTSSSTPSSRQSDFGSLIDQELAAAGGGEYPANVSALLGGGMGGDETVYHMDTQNVVRHVYTPGGEMNVGLPETGPMSMQSWELLSKFYDQSFFGGDQDYLGIQQALFISGYYGSKDIDDIDWGMRDEATFDAWKNLIQNTARHNSVDGNQTTWQELLWSGLDGKGGRGRGGGKGGGGGGGSIVSVSDPKSLNEILDRTAQQILGRKVNGDDKRAFVAAVHELQRSGQVNAQATAKAGGTATMVQVDPNAQAIDTVRTNHADEATAHDAALQIGNLMQILGGGR